MEMKIFVEGDRHVINTEKLLEEIHKHKDDFEVNLEYTIDNHGNINITGTSFIPPSENKKLKMCLKKEENK